MITAQEVDVALRDGSTLHIRPVRPDDEPALRELFNGLSDRSRWFRFFSGGASMDRAAAWAVEVLKEGGFGLIALAGDEPRVVGHAAYGRTDTERAEIAFAVSDEWQGVGVATILLAHLAEAAQERGISVFTASVLPSNHRMLQVFRDSGFPVVVKSRPGVLEVELPTSLSQAARERFDARDRIAAAAAVRRFLQPESVALVGASRRPGTIGAALAANLRAAGFTGPLHLVNSHGGEVDGLPLRRSVLDIDGPLDLAVIAVPAASVAATARQCAQKGVRSLVVVSAGFAEAGPEGAERQRELLSICRSEGMRLVGPNCLGVLNAAPDVRLNATFAPSFPPAGTIGFMSQSGGVGIAVIERARALGLGLSSFASVGNKGDVSGNDFLQYWEEDDDTQAIVLYLESFGNPRRFARVARRVSERKPILAVKAGRTPAGARAAGSHTGALLAASDVTVDALFQAAGVIRADTLGELFDVAALVTEQPLPGGRSVAVLTNAGGPGILCADALEGQDLVVPPLSDSVREELASFLPETASLANPVDMIAGATARDYEQALGALIAEEAIDAVVAIFVPPLVTAAEDVAAAIARAIAGGERRIPVLAVFMTEGAPPGSLSEGPARVPAYAFPEDAARALGRAATYADWRRRPRRAPISPPGIRRDEASAILAHALADGGGWLTPAAIAGLCSCYGLPLLEWRSADDPRAAGRAARALGGAVALKAVAPGLVHKTEAGGVQVGLRGEATVRRAAEQMHADVIAAGHPAPAFLVQRMAPIGVEMLVGVVQDRHFGPVVACGAGGTAAELLRDVAVRLAPLEAGEASEMVRSLTTFPLLDGYRGAPAADVAALEDALERISALVEDHPDIAELDCNPVIVGPDGAKVVDMRVRVAPAVPPPPAPSLESW